MTKLMNKKFLIKIFIYYSNCLYSCGIKKIFHLIIFIYYNEFTFDFIKRKYLFLFQTIFSSDLKLFYLLIIMFIYLFIYLSM